MPTTNSVLRWNKKLTNLIIEHTGDSTPNGLNEATNLIRGEIPFEIEKKLRFLAKIRNRIAHEEGFEEDRIPANYDIVAGEVLTFFKNNLFSKSKSEDKKQYQSHFKSKTEDKNLKQNNSNARKNHSYSNFLGGMGYLGSWFFFLGLLFSYEWRWCLAIVVANIIFICLRPLGIIPFLAMLIYFYFSGTEGGQLLTMGSMMLFLCFCVPRRVTK